MWSWPLWGKLLKQNSATALPAMRRARWRVCKNFCISWWETSPHLQSSWAKEETISFMSNLCFSMCLSCLCSFSWGSVVLSNRSSTRHVCFSLCGATVCNSFVVLMKLREVWDAQHEIGNQDNHKLKDQKFPGPMAFITLKSQVQHF